MLTPKKAKRLTKRKGQSYAMVEDSDRVEWLVDAVVDNGRQMRLILPETKGETIRHVSSKEYKDYKVLLDENDIEL